MAVLAEWDDGSLPARTGGVFTLGNYASVWPLDWINIDHNGSGAAQLRWDFGTDQPVVSLRTYFRTPPAWPTATNQFASLEPEASSGSLIGLAFAGESNGGQLRLVTNAGFTVIGASPVRLLQPSRWYRFSLQVDFAAETARARVWHLHADDASPLWDSGTVATQVAASARARILNIGAVQGSLLLGHARMAHMRCTDTATLVARHSSDTYPWNPTEGDYSQIRLVQGGSLVNPETVQLWDYGGSLVPAVSATYSAYVPEPEPEPDPVGTVTASLTFEGQTNGQPLSLSSPWSEAGQSGGTAFQASAAAARHGTLGARCTSSSGFRQINHNVAVDVSGATIRTYDWWVRVNTMSTNVWLFATDGNESTLRLNSNGTVRMQDDAVAVDTSTATMSTGVWYRVALMLSSTGQTCRIYEGTDTEPAIELSGPLSTPTWNSARFGLIGASNGTTFDLDTIRIGDGGWLPAP